MPSAVARWPWLLGVHAVTPAGTLFTCPSPWPLHSRARCAGKSQRPLLAGRLGCLVLLPWGTLSSGRYSVAGGPHLVSTHTCPATFPAQTPFPISRPAARDLRTFKPQAASPAGADRCTGEAPPSAQFSCRWSLEATSESGCLQMSLWGRHPQATWKHPGHARFFFLLPDKSLHQTLACVAETHCVYGVRVAAASEASRSREQGPCKGVGQHHPRDQGGKSVPTLSPPGSQSGTY